MNNDKGDGPSGPPPLSYPPRGVRISTMCTPAYPYLVRWRPIPYTFYRKKRYRRGCSEGLFMKVLKLLLFGAAAAGIAWGVWYGFSRDGGAEYVYRDRKTHV